MFTFKPGHYVLYLPSINKYIGCENCGYPYLADLNSLYITGDRTGTVFFSKQGAREYIETLDNFNMLEKMTQTKGLSVKDIEVKELSYNLEEVRI